MQKACGHPLVYQDPDETESTACYDMSCMFNSRWGSATRRETISDRPPALPALPQTIQSEAASTVHVLPWLGTSPRHQPWRTLRMPNFKGHCWRYLVVHDLSTSKLCTSWILLLMSQSSLHCGWWLGHRAVIRSKTRLSVFHDSEFHLVEVFATIEINFPFLWCTPFISSSNILTIATTA